MAWKVLSLNSAQNVLNLNLIFKLRFKIHYLFLNNCIYFIIFWLCCIFIAEHQSSLVVVHSLLTVGASLVEGA